MHTSEAEHQTLYSERMMIVAGPDHALAGTRVGALNALAGERWIAFPELPGRPEASGEHVRRILDAAGVGGGQILRIDSLTAQKRLVEAGFGIALVPDSAVQEEFAAGSLVGLDVDGLDVRVPVMLVTRRNGYLAAATRSLLAELREACVTGEPLGS